MQERRMGRTGLKVSEICLGTMTFAGQCDQATSFQILDVARGRGVTFLDTADAYPIPPDPETAGRTEEVLGRWLAQDPSRRQQIVLATKCRIKVGHGPNDQGLSRRHILAACEASLRRLRTDWIDLYQAHSPDPETPIDETLRAMDDLVRSGKVRYVGCSNYPGLAARAGGLDQPAAWLGPVRLRAAPLQRVVPRDRDRSVADVPRSGSGGDRLQPLGWRLSEWQAFPPSGSTAGHPVFPRSLRRVVSRPLLACRPVRGGRSVENLLRAAGLEPGHRQRGVGPRATWHHVRNRRGQPSRPA